MAIKNTCLAIILLITILVIGIVTKETNQYSLAKKALALPEARQKANQEGYFLVKGVRGTVLLTSFHRGDYNPKRGKESKSDRAVSC